ncbi:MAG: iron-containing alcohol dehydrogenase, partial [Duodenibacillus sp.]|nr:iron-containing alcohol dehydrogenase [Duodenibacillus sp.]
AVLTIPAAGSEQSIRSVINNGEVKTGIGTEHIRPRVACVNPELFFTLPEKQIAAGVLDMMSHIMERYFTNTPAVDYTTGQAEAALRCIMDNGLKVIADREDYDAWAQVGLAGSFAHNGYFGLGHEEDWACHAIEHALSGWDPSITHGEGLAVVIPSWMRYVMLDRPGRLERFALEVMRVEDTGEQSANIELGVAKLCAFMQKMTLPSRLSQLTEAEVPVKLIGKLACPKGPIGKFRPLSASDVEAIVSAVL